MRILKLELNNFRQFYGHQHIDFTGTADQNVVVVYGENGRGKTGIYRALMFCLYGHRLLDQDRNYDKGDGFQVQKLYLVNTAALAEAAANGTGTEASVKVIFDHEGREYEMQRSLYAIQKADGSTVENDNGVKLVVRGPDGNAKVFGNGDEESIGAHVNAILNERVKDYFLFDGERIERLTKVTNQQRKEIQNGIRNLLKIDELYTAQRTLKLLEERISKDLQNVSTGNYRKKLAEKESLDSQIQQCEKELDNYEREVDAGQLQLDEVERELANVSDHIHLLDKQKDLESRMKTLKADRVQNLANMRKFTTTASVLLARDLIDQVYVDLEDKREKGQVPSDLKKELIERLLQEMQCICGTSIHPESAEHLHLQLWLKQASSQSLEKHVMEFYGKLNATRALIDSKAGDLITLLTSFGNLEEESDSVGQAWEDLDRQLEGRPKTDVTEKQRARNTLVRKIASLEESQRQAKQQLQALKNSLTDCKSQLEVLAKESNLHQELQGKLSLTDKSGQAMERVIQAFVEEVRRDLEEAANHNFQRLLDEDGRKTLKQIVVGADYTLEVLDWLGRPFLANISAGQRQIVSLCFITALAQVAGGAHVLEVPLFMDTPFGRLSSEHRYNLLTEIPLITPQWVLLATETEFTSKECELLRASGKWSRLYILEAQREGVTTIKEASVQQFQPAR